MRRTLGKIPYPVIGRATTSASSSTVGFSTASAGGGGGRGRGRSTPDQFSVDRNEHENSKGDNASPPPHGHGRGRGKSLPSSPVLPSFSSFLNNDSKAPPLGRGRGFIPTKSTSPPQQEESELPSGKPQSNVKKSFFFVKDENAQDDRVEFQIPTRQEKTLPDNILNTSSGAGRGKPIKAPAEAQSDKPKTENRHIRRRQPEKTPPRAVASAGVAAGKSSPRKQLSQEEKARKAMGILSKGNQEGGGDRDEVTGGRDARGGRRRGKGRFARRERGDWYKESDDEPDGLNLGDPADEEKVAQKLGPEVMNELAEGFEEMSSRVLPSPVDDSYLDALHTNLSIECEPEYLMEEFGTNPDIDEKPPIPLRDALEKMKPFLMAYEGIQSQEEWEEVMEETMKTVPLIKEIVDHYSGPDRVTAKQQQQELERVAKTLPASAPASVKRFTDRAVLSLQGNPGWGFDKKCQFMDKLVMEVSKQYK